MLWQGANGGLAADIAGCSAVAARCGFTRDDDSIRTLDDRGIVGVFGRGIVFGVDV